jgi:hypothetical protein
MGNPMHRRHPSGAFAPRECLRFVAYQSHAASAAYGKTAPALSITRRSIGTMAIFSFDMGRLHEIPSNSHATLSILRRRLYPASLVCVLIIPE